MAKPIGPICNLDCSYCYYLDRAQMYPIGEDFRMSPSDLEAYIQQYIACSAGPQVDFVWQGGEPTLLGIEFFRKAVELEQKYVPPGWVCTNALQTNGTRLDDAWGRFLKRENFLVGISIDGPEALHDAFRVDRNGRSTHEGVMQGLRALQRHNVEYNVLCVVGSRNSGSPHEVYQFFKAHQIDWIQFIPLVTQVGAGEASSSSVSPEGYGEFLIAIFDQWIRHDVGRVFIQIFEECLSVWSGLGGSLCIFRETCGDALVVEHNGDLFSCDHFVDPQHKLGNIAVVPLADLVEAPAQVRFGLAKRDTLPRYCHECNVRFMCNGGCPKERFVRAPDGEPGLNYLCAGYKRFFTHVDPYMRRMAELWRSGADPAGIMAELRSQEG